MTPGHSAVVERQAVDVPKAEVGAPPLAYIVGPNDRLYINVNGQAELSTVIPGGNIGQLLGARVDGHGFVQLPEVGRVRVAGWTTLQIRDHLMELFAAEGIRDPWVTVEVLEHRSQPVYLIGEFNDPGVVFMDRQTNILQAMARGRGPKESAFLRGARLIRDDQVVPVDIYNLLRHGATDQNLWLWPEDTLYMPSLEDQVVFVLGDVRQPGAVPMVQGRLTLSQAVAEAGGLTRIGSNLEQVRLIRSLTQTRGEFMVIDLTRILSGQALPFPLEPGDIVYIPRNRVGTWNDVLAEITPTIQLVTGLVTPFAQIITVANNTN